LFEKSFAAAAAQGINLSAKCVAASQAINLSPKSNYFYS